MTQETKLALKTVKGDLFTSSDSLAHCVSLDFKMGKGIALAFRNKFGRITELQEQKQKVPGLAILKDSDRFLYYLVTKEKFYQKPTYESLGDCLKLLLAHMKENKTKKLAIPRLGCGLDKLDWNKVEGMILETFKGSDIEITVYTLD